MGPALYHGDCLDILPTLEAESIDTVITDPPYGLEFMGKEWDHGVPGVKFWQACLRVANPGAALLAFGGTRTHHRLMCAIEDAGWEIRDCLMWVYGSGFPKSHDISKAIDKAAGAEREVVGYHKQTMPQISPRDNFGERYGDEGGNNAITTPATDAAALWDGWGTALKPAWEPIILAMKPRDGTFANNALEYGVAGLWVDGCRVAVESEDAERIVKRHKSFANSETRYAEGWNRPFMADQEYMRSRQDEVIERTITKGRWPANLILDEQAAAMLDEQSGERRNGGQNATSVKGKGMFRKNGSVEWGTSRFAGDTGGASRFFYCAKASRSERTCNGEIENKHPTVKPLALCRWLARLTKTPTGGVVLDPFMGSGSIGVAVIQEGRDFIGIELERESFEVAEYRIGQADPEPVQLALM